MYEDDQDLLEDVLIENKQAIEMAEIYSHILSGMMNTFSSVISNNLNSVMKLLTSITIHFYRYQRWFSSFFWNERKSSVLKGKRTVLLNLYL